MKRLLLVLCLSLLGFGASATHITGAFITFVKDTTANPNPRRYHFKLTMISDRASQADEPFIIIEMNGGIKLTVPRASVTGVGPLVDQEEFNWTYTFPADGIYTVTWMGINRNPGTLNITQPSDQLSFLLKTTIIVNTLRDPNSSPQFLAPEPISTTVGQPLNFNLLAYDPDGDSLAYKFTIPQHRDQAGNVLPVPGYTFPGTTANCNNSAGTGSALFNLNTKDGQLTWDAPCRAGDYTIAVLVEEWRNNRRMSVVTYDMTIKINSDPAGTITLGNKDALEINPDGYIETKANQEVELKINYTQLSEAPAPIAPAFDEPSVTEYFASELSQVLKAPVTYTIEKTADGAVGTFRFTPTRDLIRSRPYVVSFYGIEDNNFSTSAYFTTSSFRILVKDNEPTLKLIEAEKLPKLTANLFIVSTQQPIKFKVLAEGFPGYAAILTTQSALVDGAKQFNFTTTNTEDGTIGELEFQPNAAQASTAPQTITFKATYTAAAAEPIVKELRVQVRIYKQLPKSLSNYLSPGKFFIFPNRILDQFTVQAETPALLSIYTLQGKLILQQQVQPGATEVNRPVATSGLYFYTLTTQDGQKTTGKLLLQ